VRLEQVLERERKINVVIEQQDALDVVAGFVLRGGFLGSKAPV
jgi:hypothetical protein